MESKSYLNAVRLYMVLALLAKENRWCNVDYLSQQTNTFNSSRLKKQLVSLVERGIIQHWENLTDDEKKTARKEQIEEIIRTNNYKITNLGREKIHKIRDSCPEPEALMMLE